jgi:hypothetical protein
LRECGFEIESLGRFPTFRGPGGAGGGCPFARPRGERSEPFQNGLLPGSAGKEFFSQTHENAAFPPNCSLAFDGEAAPGGLAGACSDGTGDQVVESVTVEQNEFIQDICLGGQGNVAQHKIELGMGSRRWGRSTQFFEECEARGEREGRTGQFGWRPDVFGLRVRIRMLQGGEQKLREQCEISNLYRRASARSTSEVHRNG